LSATASRTSSYDAIRRGWGCTSSRNPPSTRQPRLPCNVPNQVVPSPGNVSTWTSLRPAAFARPITYSIAS
jgi:hypothetical protein